MPPRSNEFQRLVAIVKKHVANGALVTESKMLEDRQTGTRREVDICIESCVAGHDIVVSIECTKKARKADVKWVDEMKSKHERLPTDLLVLASASGFTSEAKRVASRYGIETLALEKLDDNSVGQFFDKVQASFFKLYDFYPTKVVVRVGQTSDLPPESVVALPANYVFTAEGKLVGTMREIVDLWLNSEWFVKEIGRQGLESHRSFLAVWTNPTIPEEGALCLEKEEPKVLRVIESIEVSGGCQFRVSRFPLSRGLLGRVRVVWGEGQVLGEKALLVATQDEAGRKQLTITAPGLKLLRSQGRAPMTLRAKDEAPNSTDDDGE